MPHVPLPGDTIDSLIDRVLELEAALASIEPLLIRRDPGVEEPRRHIKPDLDVALAITQRMLLRRRT